MSIVGLDQGTRLGIDLAGRDFLSLRELSPGDVRGLLALTAAVKQEREAYGAALAGQTIALLFEKPSLRTRVAFEVAASQLGARAVYLGPQEVGLGRRESVADVARTLEQMVQAIVVRTFSHRIVEEIAQAVSIPVINALSDFSHPCQALGDYFTLLEIKGSLKGLRLAWVGDASNVANSLVFGAALLGVRMTMASPPGYEPRPDVLAWARLHEVEPDIACRVVSSAQSAVRHADAVYTDTWVSMGQEVQAEARQQAFAGFQVTPALLACASPSAVFMHCLPAQRGREVDARVIDGPQSIVFTQAANRLHTQKALLLALLGAARST